MVLYLTNEITVESSKLLRRAYESEWIDQREETKKCFIILCEALKQSQELMILMYPMNLETFTRVNCLKSVWVTTIKKKTITDH